MPAQPAVSRTRLFVRFTKPPCIRDLGLFNSLPPYPFPYRDAPTTMKFADNRSAKGPLRRSWHD